MNMNRSFQTKRFINDFIYWTFICQGSEVYYSKLDRDHRNFQFSWFLCPQYRRSGGILFLSWLSFCHSVLLFKTLMSLITFEQWVLELWNLTWIFPVIRPFRGYHYFLPCDLALGVWPFFENYNLANNSEC